MILRIEILTAVALRNAGISNSNVARGWTCLHIALHCVVFCMGRGYRMDQNLLIWESTKYMIIRVFGIVNLYTPKPYYMTSAGELFVCGVILR
jgi:hypothetical protein